MRSIYGILGTIILMVLLVSGCGSDEKSPADSNTKSTLSDSSSVPSIIKKQTSVLEEYVNGLTNAKSADDVVKAINGYTDGMKELIPGLMEFQKKYPEYMEGKPPENMEAEVKKVQEMTAKIPGAMRETAKYMMDSSVQEAMIRMGEELSKLEK